MSYIDCIKERVRAHYDVPLAEMNWKIDTLIAMLQNRDVIVINILHVPKENVLEQVGEMAAQVYVLA